MFIKNAILGQEDPVSLLINRMAGKKTARKKRRYLSQRFQDDKGPIFLVYVYSPDKSYVKSDGPFKDRAKAFAVMAERLRRGEISWIVSYDA